MKTELKEFNLSEFERISEIMNDKSLLEVERYLDILEFLGVSDDIMNQLNEDDLFDIVKSFNVTNKSNNVLMKDIIIDGKKYIAYSGDKFIMKLKDLSLIEKFVKTNPSSFFTHAMAVIFKREDLDNTDHYNMDHILAKAKLFANISAYDVFPYMMYISDQLTKKIQKIVDAHTN